MLTIKALIHNNCQVVEAEDGKKGFEMALLHQPELILMDIALPEMSGIEVLKLIRNEHTLRHIPVIAVSASAMKGDMEHFIAHGFDGYLSKPIDSVLFEKMVRKYIPA
jgi:two-component system cell cycle response regulator DivK